MYPPPPGDDPLARLQKADPLSDPLYRLQYLARLAIQYDLADLTAMVVTPCAVSFFVWRDGWFTLQGSGILVRHCDVGRMWVRFATLLCIKPVASSIARWMLIRKMRSTLLGRRTVHGVSAVVSNYLQVRMRVRIRGTTGQTPPPLTRRMAHRAHASYISIAYTRAYRRIGTCA